ncbi:MAG: hypothetical protein HRT69_15795 [Flavobacteriaceae bacterium]|nr:hypothetical protein [Flavobacteriaceae bacterium]
MDIIFNKNNTGQEELKILLGFLDADLNFSNLQTDIELNTTDVVDFIGEDMYQKALDHYNSTDTDVKLDDIVKRIQLFIILKAYLDYAPNADLSHSNSGRKYTSDENEKIPWEWQLTNDEKANKSRCYKSLDRLILLLNKSDYPEWKDSDQYKKASGLFVKNTKEFNEVYNINNSHQLYFRLVPQLTVVQQMHIITIIGITKYDELKAVVKATDPISTPDTLLLLHIRSAIVHLALAKAYKLLPVEMFPEHLQYTENTSMKAKARAEVAQEITQIGLASIVSLTIEYAKQTATYTEIDQLQHLNEDQNYIHL